MAEPAGPFRLLRAGPGRFLCYCRPGPGPGGTVYVTDALEVWAGELGARPPLGCRCPPGEHGTKLRAALGRGTAALSLGERPAVLQLRGEAPCSALQLFKLPVAEARSQLQALLFGMAGRVESLERRLEVVETAVSSCSPEKNAAYSQQLFLPGHSESPQLWLLSAAPLSWCRSWHRRGRGSAWWLLECPGCPVRRSDAGCCQAGCSLSLQDGVRLCCSSRLEAVSGPWLPAPLGEETRLGPSSPTTDTGPGWWAAESSPWVWRCLQGCPGH
ncbi:protein PAXX isoform X2 [Caloenas nicobarica]|uniref:protein PAXX isoform X2 n=1 Tax=Caloenas nicobarica TaxID=187106 RepID=UPI0032B879CB